MDDIGLVQELFKTEAARSRGEQISEFKIARLYADSMWSDITEMMDNGVSKANIVGLIMITARIGRTAAYNVVSNKINSAANRNRKVKIKSEVSKESRGKQKASPVAAAPVPAPVPAPKPVSAPATSAPAESSHDEPLFKGSIKIGNNFHGIDDVGKRAEQNREERARSRASLAAMEEKYGTPDEFIKSVQGESKC